MLLELDGPGGARGGALARPPRAGGEALLLVGEATPRCAVPSASPDTGVRDRDVLRELVEQRGRVGGEVCLGVYAEVLEPGVVRVGDAVEAVSGWKSDIERSGARQPPARGCRHTQT